MRRPALSVDVELDQPLGRAAPRTPAQQSLCKSSTMARSSAHARLCADQLLVVLHRRASTSIVVLDLAGAADDGIRLALAGELIRSRLNWSRSGCSTGLDAAFLGSLAGHLRHLLTQRRQRQPTCAASPQRALLLCWAINRCSARHRGYPAARSFEAVRRRKFSLSPGRGLTPISPRLRLLLPSRSVAQIVHIEP